MINANGLPTENETGNDVSKIAQLYNARDFMVDAPLSGVHGYRTWSGLFASFMRSIMMKRSYEFKMGFEYDIVVKGRLDIAFPPGTVFNPPRPAPLVAIATNPIRRINFEYGYNNFNDILFYSDSPTMDILSDVDRWYMAGAFGREDHHSIGRIGPGALLYRYMVEHNIHPEHHSVIPHIIVRRDAELRKLDIIRDYMEIDRIHRDFYR